jgi:hypothetical protein
MLRTAPPGVLICLIAVGISGALAGCGGAAAERGPAWPKAAASETDGGESLAPRLPSSVAAIEEAVDATSGAGAAPTKEPGAATAPPVAAPGARPDRPAETPAPKAPDILTTEDIIIEIDD